MPAIYHEGSWLGNATDPEVLVKDTVGWTGKNLLKNTAESATARGVTRTVNSDGSITLDGTNSVSGPAVIELNLGFELEAGTYILSGTPVGAWVNNAGFRLQVFDFINSVQIATDEGSGKTFTLSEKKTLRTRIWFSDGASISNKTFYPMIRRADITDPTYEPYHESVEEVVEQIYADNGVLGAKNLLENKATSQTINGVTFTVNNDGSVTANGTTTALTILIINSAYELKAGTYILSGCPVENANVQLIKTGLDIKAYINSPTTFTLSQTESGITARIAIASGQTLSNAVFKPMLRLASDPDDTYQPYAMTNKELTVNMLTALFSHPIRLTSSDDLDNVKTFGIYEIANSVPANAPSGLSNTTFSTVFVLSAGGSAAITQIYIQGGWRSTDKHIAIRGYGSSPLAWSAWRYITDSAS